MMTTHVRRAAVVAMTLAVTGVADAQRSTKLPPRPAPAPAKAFAYPPFTVDTLPNGLRFAVVENHELPIVTVRSALAGFGPNGLWFQDPAGKEGAWGLLLTALREGTPTRSASQITDEIADLGTDFRFTSSVAFLPPWFRAAKSTWVPSLELFSDLLTNASLPAEGLARVQANLVTTLDRIPASTIANRLLYASLYGAGSEYNHFATATSVKALTRDDVLAAKRYLGPQNTLIVIAGDVTLAEARRAMRAAFGSWTRSSEIMAPVVPAAPAQPVATTIYLKDMPGQATPLIVSGQILPGRDNADGAAIEALASVLGDFSVSAGSRVYRAFRLDRGLAYSPRVELPQRPIPETVPLIGTFSVPAASIDTAVLVWLQVVRDIRSARPVLQAELDFSKNNLVGKLPLDMERLDAINFNVMTALRDRLPPTYLNDWIKRVNALTLPAVQAAATKYLDPEHMPIIVVGDRAKIEAALRATGIPVVVVP
jgi:zinc protease